MTNFKMQRFVVDEGEYGIKPATELDVFCNVFSADMPKIPSDARKDQAIAIALMAAKNALDRKPTFWGKQESHGYESSEGGSLASDTLFFPIQPNMGSTSHVKPFNAEDLVIAMSGGKFNRADLIAFIEDKRDAQTQGIFSHSDPLFYLLRDNFGLLGNQQEPKLLNLPRSLSDFGGPYQASLAGEFMKVGSEKVIGGIEGRDVLPKPGSITFVVGEVEISGSSIAM